MAGSDTTSKSGSKAARMLDLTLVLSAVRKHGQVSAPELADLYPRQAKAIDADYPRIPARRAMQALADAGKIDLFYQGRTLVAVLPGRTPSA